MRPDLSNHPQMYASPQGGFLGQKNNNYTHDSIQTVISVVIETFYLLLCDVSFVETFFDSTQLIKPFVKLLVLKLKRVNYSPTNNNSKRLGRSAYNEQ